MPLCFKSCANICNLFSTISMKHDQPYPEVHLCIFRNPITLEAIFSARDLQSLRTSLKYLEVADRLYFLNLPREKDIWRMVKAKQARYRKKQPYFKINVTVFSVSTSHNWTQQKGLNLHQSTQRAECSGIRVSKSGIINTKNLKLFKLMTMAEAFCLLWISFHCVASVTDFRNTSSENRTKKWVSKTRQLMLGMLLLFNCSAKHRWEKMRDFLLYKTTARTLHFDALGWVILFLHTQTWKWVLPILLERIKIVERIIQGIQRTLKKTTFFYLKLALFTAYWLP